MAAERPRDRDHRYASVAAALASPPWVLLLGQRYLAPFDAPEPLLQAVQDRTGADATSLESFLLDDTSSATIRRSHVAEAAPAIAVADDIANSLRRPWKMVFTSSVDNIVDRLLRLDQIRDVRQVFSEDFDPRSDAVLKLIRLFGAVDRSRSDEWPPENGEELRSRRRATRQSLGNLGEIVTPSGYLFIDGWDPTLDWLRPQDLSTALTDLAVGQVLLFGIDATRQSRLMEDDDFAALLDSGVITLHAHRLYDILPSFDDESFATFTDLASVPDSIVYRMRSSTPSHQEKSVEPQTASISIARDTWHTLSQTMEILEDTRFEHVPFRSPEDQYHAFRQFLESRPEPSSEALSLMAFERPILAHLLEAALSLCSQRAPQDTMLLVAGQGASGKSVALALLAQRLRERGLPVVYSTRSIAGLNRGHLDSFCGLIESSGLTDDPVVLIYDATLDDSEYADLAGYLSGLGRKCLVVGSTYSRQDPEAHVSRPHNYGGTSVQVVPISVRLSPEERTVLIEHISKFVPYFSTDIDPVIANNLNSFFAVLYWLLPEARGPIKRSVLAEIEGDIQSLNSSLEVASGTENDDTWEDDDHTDPQIARFTTVELALRRTIGAKLDQFAAAQDQQHASRLIDSVMLASWVNLRLPQELAVRLLGHRHATYRQIMLGINVIIEVPSGPNQELSLEAREWLEAEIWMTERLREPERRFDIISQLVHLLRARELEDDSTVEMDFAVTLLQRFGPQQKDDRIRLDSYFFEMAELVHALRITVPDVHPRLLLFESNCTREWIQRDARAGARSLPVAESQTHIQERWLPRIESAAKAIDRARTALQLQSRGRRLSRGARRWASTLETERAALLGTAQHCLLTLYRADPGHPRVIAKADGFWEEAREAWDEGLAFNDENFQACDVACWMSRDRDELERMYLVHSQLSPSHLTHRRTEVLAEWNAKFDTYSAIDLLPSQEERFENRRAELMYAMSVVRDQPDMLDTIAADAETVSGRAARSLKTRIIESRDGPQAALDYISQIPESVLFSDSRLLSQYTWLWWTTQTGFDGYFPQERMQLHFTDAQWRKLNALSLSRLSLAHGEYHPLALFHYGWSSLQVGLSVKANEAFYKLELTKAGRARRARSLALMSDALGRARVFHGEVRSLGETRSRLWVDSLRTELPFDPIRISAADARIGESVGPFHIALNYRGIYAESIVLAQSNDREAIASRALAE